MTKQEMIVMMREGLDEMTSMSGITDAEMFKVNAVRFVENYRIMRCLEKDLEEGA